MRISQDGYKTGMGQEGDAIPLGIQQNNDFTQFTMDVWNDKIFYQEKEFSAGFMAMSILNIPEEELAGSDTDLWRTDLPVPCGGTGQR